MGQFRVLGFCENVWFGIKCYFKGYNFTLPHFFDMRIDHLVRVSAAIVLLVSSYVPCMYVPCTYGPLGPLVPATLVPRGTFFLADCVTGLYEFEYRAAKEKCKIVPRRI